MGYHVGTTTITSTGTKTFAPDLGGATPYAVRITAGARVNTTETSEMGSVGQTDGTVTVCQSFCPGFSKRWPYSGESNYIVALYSSSGTKVLSATFTSWDSDELVINVDTCTQSRQVTVEYWF